MSDCKKRGERERGNGEGDGERESLREQSAALCLRILSALTCSVWQLCNSKFYTVWDTNWHYVLWLFLQYNLIKRHCQWGRNQSIIKFDRHKSVCNFTTYWLKCKTSEPWLEEVLACWISSPTHSVVTISTILAAEIWFYYIFSFEVHPKILWLKLDTMLWDGTNCVNCVHQRCLYWLSIGFGGYIPVLTCLSKGTTESSTWQPYTEGKNCTRKTYKIKLRICD